MVLAFILFAVVNFAALGIGALLMGNPQTNQWYQQVNKAPFIGFDWLVGLG